MWNRAGSARISLCAIPGRWRSATAKGVVKVERARFVGRATDLTLTGAIAPQQRNAYDLRLNGRVDLTMLQDFGRDITSSGFLLTDATIRGPLTSRR